jgi:hypothetical protein
VASSSGADEHRPGPSNGDRTKRARSRSITPNSAEQACSMDSSPSSSSSHTIYSSPSNHAGANHRDTPSATTPMRRPQPLDNNSAFSTGELSHTSSGFYDARPSEASPIEPPTSSVWSNPPFSTNSSIQHDEQFRLSMERFHAYDSQISTVRARASPLPFYIPPSSPTLPPLTLSSCNAHCYLDLVTCQCEGCGSAFDHLATLQLHVYEGASPFPLGLCLSLFLSSTLTVFLYSPQITYPCTSPTTPVNGPRVPVVAFLRHPVSRLWITYPTSTSNPSDVCYPVRLTLHLHYHDA